MMTGTPASVSETAAKTRDRYTISRSASVYVGCGVTIFRISSSSSSATGVPACASRAAAARATVDLPLPGRPVIQIAQLIGRLQHSHDTSAGSKRGQPRQRAGQVGEIRAHRSGQVRIPARVSDDQRAEREERGQRLEQLVVAAGLEVGVQEVVEQGAERLGHATLAVAGRLAHAEEEVVDGERAHVVGRLAPLAAAAVEDAEVRPLAEQEVPRDGNRRGCATAGGRDRAAASASAPSPRSSASHAAGGSSGRRDAGSCRGCP